uniref:Uncharacterized protein n=1 Tax=Sphaerodactylus townsendi TaxID=933632 RepID=A0ACB8EC84_9SAUR
MKAEDQGNLNALCTADMKDLEGQHQPTLYRSKRGRGCTSAWHEGRSVTQLPFPLQAILCSQVPIRKCGVHHLWTSFLLQLWGNGTPSLPGQSPRLCPACRDRTRLKQSDEALIV